MSHNHRHFRDKEAIEHVIEAQAKGLIDSTEIHGAELPGHISAAADAAKETSIVLATVWALLAVIGVPEMQMLEVLGIFAIAWLIWKGGRSAWLGWARLERLHRVLAQEKWEIEHQRPQERIELKALYEAKGFEGKLLDDVVDVLMADGDRLLKVMVEEEMGLSLGTQEHPLKQSLGAAIGTILATLACMGGLLIYPAFGTFIAALIVIAIAACVAARYEGNEVIPAITWNTGLGIFAFGTVYFLIQFFFGYQD